MVLVKVSRIRLTKRVVDKLDEKQIEELGRTPTHCVEDVLHVRCRLWSTRRSGTYWVAYKGGEEATEEIREYLNNAPYNPVLEFASKEAVVFYNLPIHTEGDIYSWKNAVTKFIEEHFENKDYILVLQYHECYTIFPNYIDIFAFSADPKVTISPYKLRKRIVELLLNEMKQMKADFDDLQGNLKYIRFRGPGRTLSIDAEKEIKEIVKKLKEFGVYLPSRIKLFNHILEAENGIFIPADNYRVLIPTRERIPEIGYDAVFTVSSPDHPLCLHNEIVECITLFYHPFPQPEEDSFD